MKGRGTAKHGCRAQHVHLDHGFAVKHGAQHTDGKGSPHAQGEVEHPGSGTHIVPGHRVHGGGVDRGHQQGHTNAAPDLRVNDHPNPHQRIQGREQVQGIGAGEGAQDSGPARPEAVREHSRQGHADAGHYRGGQQQQARCDGIPPLHLLQEHRQQEQRSVERDGAHHPQHHAHGELLPPQQAQGKHRMVRTPLHDDEEQKGRHRDPDSHPDPLRVPTQVLPFVQGEQPHDDKGHQRQIPFEIEGNGCIPSSRIEHQHSHGQGQHSHGEVDGVNGPPIEPFHQVAPGGGPDGSPQHEADPPHAQGSSPLGGRKGVGDDGHAGGHQRSRPQGLNDP